MSKKTVDENFLKILENKIDFTVNLRATLKHLRNDLAAQLESFAELCENTLVGRPLSSISTKRHLKAMVSSTRDLKNFLSKATSIDKEAEPVTYDDLYGIFKRCNTLWKDIYKSEKAQHSDFFANRFVQENLERLCEGIKNYKYAFIGLANERNGNILLNELNEFLKQFENGTPPKNFDYKKPISISLLKPTTIPKSTEQLSSLRTWSYTVDALPTIINQYLYLTIDYGQTSALVQNLKDANEKLKNYVNKEQPSTSSSTDDKNVTICDNCKKLLSTVNGQFKLDCGHMICTECARLITVSKDKKWCTCPCRLCRKTFPYTSFYKNIIELSKTRYEKPNTQGNDDYLEIENFLKMLEDKIDFAVNQKGTLKNLKDDLAAQLEQFIILFKGTSPGQRLLSHSILLRSLISSAVDLKYILSVATSVDDNRTDPVTYNDLNGIFKRCNTLWKNIYKIAPGQYSNFFVNKFVKENLERLCEGIKNYKYAFIGLSNECNGNILLNEINGFLKQFKNGTPPKNFVYKKPITLFLLEPTTIPNSTEQLSGWTASHYSSDVSSITINQYLYSTIDYGHTSTLMQELKDATKQLENCINDDQPSTSSSTNNTTVTICDNCKKQLGGTTTWIALSCGHRVCAECAQYITVSKSKDWCTCPCPSCQNKFPYTMFYKNFIELSKTRYKKTNTQSNDEISAQEAFSKKLNDIPADDIKILKIDLKTWLDNIYPIIDAIMKLCQETQKEVPKSRKDTQYHLKNISNCAADSLKKLEELKQRFASSTSTFDIVPLLDPSADLTVSLYPAAVSLNDAAKAHFHDPIHTSILNYPHTRTKFKELANLILSYRRALCVIIFEKECEFINEALSPVKDTGDISRMEKPISWQRLYYPHKIDFGFAVKTFRLSPAKGSPYTTIFIEIKNLIKLIDKCPYGKTERMSDISKSLNEIAEKIKKRHPELFVCVQCNRTFKPDDVIKCYRGDHYLCKICAQWLSKLSVECSSSSDNLYKCYCPTCGKFYFHLHEWNPWNPLD